MPAPPTCTSSSRSMSRSLFVDVDRTQAQDIGLTQRDVADSLLVSLSGSFQTSPTYWLNPKNGVSYNIATQTPQYPLDSLEDLENIPITSSAAPSRQCELQHVHPCGAAWAASRSRSWAISLPSPAARS